MQKKVLTEQALYYGNVSMPKGFEIDYNQLKSDIFQSKMENSDFKFSKNWDKLNTYIREHFNLKYDQIIQNKLTWGNIYKPSEITIPLLEANPVDLKHSPDFVLLYGVQVKKCFVKIFYDDNRRKGRRWDIELKDNMFIMFPATNTYVICNEREDDLSFVQTITYEFR